MRIIINMSFDANLFGSETLINCWIREGGAVQAVTDGILCIPLERRPGEALEVFYRDRTLLGDVRLKQGVRLGDRDLEPMALAEILVAEMGPGLKAPSGKKPDWKENIESSVEVFRALAKRPAFGEKLDFLSSEQGLHHGHRFHPSPKSRIGFTEQDLERYSPEWGARFRLHYFGLKEESVLLFGEASAQERWRAESRERFGSGDLWVLPVHPWQARQARLLPEIQRAICQESIVDLGEAGPEFFATSSVRTLYQPQWDRFVKTSLDVRITNCFRRNLPCEMETVSHVNRIAQLFPVNQPTLRVMPESMSMDLDIPSSLHFGAIFRDGIEPERKEGIEPLLGAALFGDRQFSVERMRKFLSSDRPISEWFEEYCEALVPPVLDAFLRFGIMFEAHLQNVLVGVRGGRVVRFVVRDLDNVKVVDGSLAARAMQEAPERVRKEAIYTEEHAWKRMVYCLVVNHLAEAIATLARVEATRADEILMAERGLWGVLVDVLRYRCKPHPRLDHLLNSPVLWSKMNFHSRIGRTEDRIAPFATVANPLSYARTRECFNEAVF